jgi:hypothetical protein
MKPEYKYRTTELLNSVDSKVTKLLNMLEGKQPANTEDAINLCNQIKKTIETVNNIIDIS